MTQKKRKFTREQRANMAREERDYVHYCRLADPSSGDITPQDREWVLSKSDQYLAFLLALEDCYKNFTTHGIRQGNCSPNEWEAWLYTLTEEERYAEAMRIFVKVTTEIGPYLEQQNGR